MSDAPRAYPNNMDRYTQMLWDMVYDLRDQLPNVTSRVEAVAAQIPTPTAIRDTVQSNGAAPANVTALVGRLMTNQYSYVPKFTGGAPPIVDPSASVGDGTLITVVSVGNTGGAGILQRWNEPFDIGTFQAQQAIGANLIDTHANRLANFPASSYEPGTVFFETDRSVLYVVKSIASINTWIYVTGIMPTALAGLPNDLGTNDGGFLALISDYFQHWLLWNGITWQFGPGDPGSKYIVATPGIVPNGGMWGACDGSAYTCLNGDGTTSSVTTPNLTGDVFLKGGTYGPQQAASRATWDPTAITDDESSHQHTVTEPSSNLGNVQLGATPFFGVAGGTVLSGPGSAHHHTLSVNAKLNVPSEGNGGLPLRIPLTWYMRR